MVSCFHNHHHPPDVSFANKIKQHLCCCCAVVTYPVHEDTLGELLVGDDTRQDGVSKPADDLLSASNLQGARRKTKGRTSASVHAQVQGHQPPGRKKPA